jgi:uncharacterized protein
LTGAVVRLDDSAYEALSKLVSKEPPISLADEIGADSLKALLECGVLVDFDEVEELKSRFAKAKEGTDRLDLCVLPTLSCNMACAYCYETTSAPCVSEKLHDSCQRGLVSLVADRLSDGVKKLTLLWFGGEPLLALNLVTELTGAIREMAEKRSVQFSASMVTNGTLLTARRAGELVSAGVKSFQITLDGPREAHNKRRPFRDGSGDSYGSVLRGLKLLAKMDVKLTIRVNVDRANAPSISALLDELRSQGLHDSPAVRIYFAPVLPSVAGCRPGTCFDLREFSEIEITLARGAHERGFSLPLTPRPRSLPCRAITPTCFVVEPSGAVQKCLGLVGRESTAVGWLGVDGFHVADPSKLDSWHKWSPFSAKCLECKALPICMGGCPLGSLPGDDSPRAFDTQESPCSSRVHNLEEMLRLLVETR